MSEPGVSPAEVRLLHEELRDGFYSPSASRRQQVVRVLTDFVRVAAREMGLRLPVLLIDGCIPVYGSDLLNGPAGRPPPDIREVLRERIRASPFAVPDPWVAPAPPPPVDGSGPA